MSIALILGSIWAGLTSVFGKVWDIFKSILDWFFRVMPKPLQFVIFLYFILFFSSMIVPKFIGMGMTCDSKGNAYSFNFLDTYVQSSYIDNLADMCGFDITGQPSNTANSTWLVLPFGEWMSMFKSVFVTTPLKPMTAYKYMKSGELDTSINQTCRELAVFLNSNPNDIMSKDFVLQHFAQKDTNTDYKSIIHVQCSLDKNGEYFPSLYFYEIDIFDFTLWLVLGLSFGLVYFAFWWYRMTIK